MHPTAKAGAGLDGLTSFSEFTQVIDGGANQDQICCTRFILGGPWDDAHQSFYLAPHRTLETLGIPKTVHKLS